MHHAAREHDGKAEMKKSLGLFDLTALGIAAIIGAGIFSTIGTAAFNGGPAVSVLFIFTALACGFSALCYARFASVIPISGSAYTYAYASFGELIAWIIGWDLIMEYAVGNIAVAISWSEYFTGFCSGMGLHIPEFLSIDYLSASRGYTAVVEQLSNGAVFTQLSQGLQDAYYAWTSAPEVSGIKLILDLPAFSIVVFITVLVFIGIYESKMAGNIMVLLKITILILFIGVGAFYVNPENWSPFAPNGIGGMLKGVSGVFFAYIGFDAISTTAEECKRPQRDLPRSIILSLLITTVLYVIISLVLTGMAHYSNLAVGDPLAYVFEKVGLKSFSGIIALSAVISMASVLLVFQLGQPRIWMSMSRDGLLPPKFSSIHKKFKTPWFSTIITGILVSVPTLFMNLTEVTDLTSIGTLFAFVLVSGGVLILDNPKKNKSMSQGKGFKIPYYNSRYYLSGLICILIIAAFFIPEKIIAFAGFNTNADKGLQLISDHIPVFIFLAGGFIFSIFAIIRQYSLIPVLGLLTNLYLMSQLGFTNWMRFLIWLGIGLVLYFTYGYKHSLLRKKH